MVAGRPRGRREKPTPEVAVSVGCYAHVRITCPLTPNCLDFSASLDKFLIWGQTPLKRYLNFLQRARQILIEGGVWIVRHTGGVPGEGHRKTLGVVGRRVPEENIETQRGAARLAKTPQFIYFKSAWSKCILWPLLLHYQMILCSQELRLKLAHWFHL